MRAGSGAPLALGGRGITGSEDWAIRDDDSPCHRLWRIFGVACSRVAEELVCLCLCLRFSSDRLVGRDWPVAKRMRTLTLEVGLQSAQVVVGQHADSPSSLELDVWLVAEAEELVAMLALRRVQCLLKTLLGDKPH